ncbi:MAG: hypothetical protein EAX96_06970 [Candidatus Lokiarchaeota archaeon]|nr:hypothetical protein [Candidatus Lokiarchaeota archaeon]
MSITSVLMACLAIFSVSIMIPTVSANANPLTLYCVKATIIPTLDGNITAGEWADAVHYRTFHTPTSNHYADYVDVFCKHNNTHLFLAYDVEGDNSSDADDVAFIYLDLNNNGTKDLEIVINRDGSFNHVLQGPSIFIELTNLQNKTAFGFGTSPLESRNHAQFELAIAINRSATYSGENLSLATKLPFGKVPIGVIFAGNGTLEPDWFFGNNTDISYWNVTGDSNASFYADLNLVDLTLGEIFPPNSPTIPGFEVLLTFLTLVTAAGLIILKKKKGIPNRILDN